MKKRIVFLLLFVCWAASSFGYSDKKVILLANRKFQVDTIGYNFVSELSRHVYKWVMDDKITLWDSPEKKYQIKKSDLTGIESSSGTTFLELPNVFIYETWSGNKRKFSFNNKGFSFSGQNAKGEEILYGYVDYDNKLKMLLQGAQMRVNANASYGTTLYAALMNKAYDFTLIFLDNTPIKDYAISRKIVQKCLSPKTRNLNAVKIPDRKLVEYVVEAGPGQASVNSEMLIKHLQDFFNQNPQEFYNYGGGRVYSYLKKNPILISDFRVLEEWTKTDKSPISYRPVSIIPDVVGIALDTITIKQLADWKLDDKGDSYEELLTKKDFYYRLVQINDTYIEPTDADAYRAALFANKWNNILIKPKSESEKP